MRASLIASMLFGLYVVSMNLTTIMRHLYE